MTSRNVTTLLLAVATALSVGTVKADVSNDTCAAAQSIAGSPVVIVGDNSAASAADDGTASCAPGSHHDAWFDYTAFCTGLVTIDTAGSAQLDTVLSVFDACGGNEIVCNDDIPGDVHAQVTLPSIAGQHYRIRLASAADPGPFRLTVICARPPANDHCSNARVITNGTPAAMGTNVLADATNDMEASCAPISNGDVWFSYTATCDGIVHIDTIGSEIADPVLSVYDNCNGNEIACNDDDPAGGSLQSSLSFNASNGVIYLIRLAALSGPARYMLNVSCLSVPANDTCATALPIANGTPAASGDNSLAAAVNDVEASCALTSLNDVWYQYAATCDGMAFIDTRGSLQSDTVLTIYTACGGPEIACSDDADGSVEAAVSFPVTSGQPYLIRLASAVQPGPYVLNVACHPIPTNDTCATARLVTNGTTQGDNTLASPTDDAESGCQPDSNSDVWFTYIAACDGLVSLDTSGSDQQDTVLSIYDSCGGAELACNDDVEADLQAHVTFPASVGQTFRIRLASLGAPENYKLNISCLSLPTNDSCATAQLVSDGAPAFVGNNALASDVDEAEATCEPNSDHDVWFVYIPQLSGIATIDTLGSAQLDTVLSVYDQCNGTEIICNDDMQGSMQARVIFPVTQNTPYLIRLASDGPPGDYHLNIYTEAPPANDSCATALPVTTQPRAATGSNALASLIDDASASCSPAAHHDIWFSYRSICDGPVTIDTAGSGQPDTVLSIHDGCGGAEIACNDDNENDLQAHVTFNATRCHTYLIRLASAAQPGDFVLNISCGGHVNGDLNCDGAVDGDDIQPFMLLIMNAPDFTAYQAQYPTCDPLLADMDCSGAVDMDDVSLFVSGLMQH